MALFLGQTRSGIEAIDERKRKRTQSNRESARRSRVRKRKRLEDLTSEMRQLQMTNGQIVESVIGQERARVQIELMNDLLRAQVMELTYRFRSLNSVLQIVEEHDGFAVDIPEIPDLRLQPWQWQLYLPMHMAMASPNVFLV